MYVSQVATVLVGLVDRAHHLTILLKGHSLMEKVLNF